jgi:hypothetical protein
MGGTVVQDVRHGAHDVLPEEDDDTRSGAPGIYTARSHPFPSPPTIQEEYRDLEDLHLQEKGTVTRVPPRLGREGSCGKFLEDVLDAGLMKSSRSLPQGPPERMRIVPSRWHGNPW